MGFTFDNTDTKGIATPNAEMNRLIEKNPQSQEVIFPYIGGSEVNTSPTHYHHLYVIDFGEKSEEDCRKLWPDLMAIVEARVKPGRLESIRQSKSSHAQRSAIWWQHYHHAKDLYDAIVGMNRVLVVNCGATPHLSFVFMSSSMVFAHSLAVFPLSSFSSFSTLQSRPHEIWARFFGSSMKDDLRYTPSDCFETFPFPENWKNHPVLEAVGKEYYEFRAALMVRNNEGLTKTYNRFHDPYEKHPDILHLRELHAAMDRAVLDAYGWNDISTECDFLLDYEIEDEEAWGNKKKPYRYRWPEGVHDEVLARLLELNAERARQEALAGEQTGKKVRLAKRASSGGSTTERDLFT